MEGVLQPKIMNSLGQSGWPGSPCSSFSALSLQSTWCHHSCHSGKNYFVKCIFTLSFMQPYNVLYPFSPSIDPIPLLLSLKHFFPWCPSPTSLSSVYVTYLCLIRFPVWGILPKHGQLISGYTTKECVNQLSGSTEGLISSSPLHDEMLTGSILGMSCVSNHSYSEEFVTATSVSHPEELLKNTPPIPHLFHPSVMFSRPYTDDFLHGS